MRWVVFSMTAVAMSCGPKVQTDGEAWLTQNPVDAAATELAPDLWSPVDDMKRDIAVALLDDVSFRPLSQGWHRTLAGASHECSAGRTPWLLRAVHGHRYTGRYFVTRAGAHLWVHHSSLGRSSPAARDALIACLDVAPTQLDLTRTVAE